MKDFRELTVWHKSHVLTVAVYQGTVGFPKHELYGLSSQMRRACSSIPSNIAEGCGRGSNAELAHFLQVAMGSASELEYWFLLARDLGYLPETDHPRFNDGIVEVKRMLADLILKVRADS